MTSSEQNVTVKRKLSPVLNNKHVTEMRTSCAFVVYFLYFVVVVICLLLLLECCSNQNICVQTVESDYWETSVKVPMLQARFFSLHIGEWSTYRQAAATINLCEHSLIRPVHI